MSDVSSKQPAATTPGSLEPVEEEPSSGSLPVVAWQGLLPVVAWQGLLEARRLARNPVWLVGSVLVAAWFRYDVADYPPVLGRDSIYVSKAVLILAPLAAILVNLAALRAERVGATDFIDSLPYASTATRPALLLATIVVPVYALVATAALVGWLVVDGAVGSPNVAELLVGPVICWLAACGGLLAGRVPLLRRRPAGVLVLVLAAFIVNVALVTNEANRLRWLAPFIDFNTRVDAIELARRPALAHLAYLLGLTAVVAVLSVARLRLAWTAALAVSVALVAASTGLQLRGATAGEIAHAEALIAGQPGTETCRTEQMFEVCTLKGYAGWANDYLDEAEKVTRGLQRDDRRLRLQQRPDRVGVDAYPEATTLELNSRLVAPPRRDTLTFGMHGLYAPGLAYDLRAAVAMWFVGLPPAPGAPAPSRMPKVDLIGGSPPLTYCSASNQGRVAVGLFLAIRNDPDSIDELAMIAELAAAGPQGGASYQVSAGGVQAAPRDALLAVELARHRSPNAVIAALHSRWDDIRSGSATLDDVAELTGVDLPPPDTPEALDPLGRNVPPCG